MRFTFLSVLAELLELPEAPDSATTAAEKLLASVLIARRVASPTSLSLTTAGSSISAFWGTPCRSPAHDGTGEIEVLLGTVGGME